MARWRGEKSYCPSAMSYDTREGARVGLAIATTPIKSQRMLLSDSCHEQLTLGHATSEG